MEYCLIEKWQPDYILPENSTAVALTQEAIFYLEQSRIQYITLEDFYTSGEIKRDADEFLLRQLSWFDDFDQLLKEIFPDADRLNVNLATIYYYWIKYAVDNIISTERILKKFVESASPTKIWFIEQQYISNENKQRFYYGFENAESTYSCLIEPICRKYGINFQRLAFDRVKHSKNNLSIRQYSKGNIGLNAMKLSIKKFLPGSILSFRNRLIQKFRHLYILLKSGRFRHNHRNIFVLRSSALVKGFCIDMRRHGFDLLFKAGNRVKKLSCWPWSKRIEINRFREIRVKDGLNWPDIFRCLSDGEIMGRINQECGLDVSSVLNSRFEYFLKETCPEILAKIQDYIEFYDKNKIDFVVTDMVWTIDEHAALTAARLSRTTKGVGIAHGADAYETRSRFFYLTRQFDLFFCLSEDEAECERNLAKLFHYAYPEVHVFSYFQREYFRKFGENKPFRYLFPAKKKRIVVFVPIVCGQRPGRPIELIQPFPMEYVKWHRALAEYLSKRDDYFFIWKGFFLTYQTFDLTAETIKERRYRNIQFDSGKLTRWFPVADRILLDVPSTAFFETIYSGLPAMALYRPSDEQLRKDACEKFRFSLRPYTSIDEGLKLVGEFLDGNREKYIIPHSEIEISIPEILKSHLSG